MKTTTGSKHFVLYYKKNKDNNIFNGLHACSQITTYKDGPAEGAKWSWEWTSNLLDEILEKIEIGRNITTA